jgi:hypothetical protein
VPRGSSVFGSGRQAEERVERAVRAALPSGARLYANVAWVASSRPGGPARDGEADLVVVHPEHGLLVVETKGGPLARDGFGRWYVGGRVLEVSPFHQASISAHVLVEKVAADPRWDSRPDWQLRALHAVACPDVDRASLARRGEPPPTALGPDAPLELLLDRADLSSPEATARALERVFGYWSGDGSRDRRLTDEQLAIIDAVLTPTAALRPLLARDLEEAEQALLRPTRAQLHILDVLRREPRASIVGPAGSGKTVLAVEKARRLAEQGLRVLLVCFNAPLQAALARHPDLEAVIDGGRLVVATFHQLCQRLAKAAGTLPPSAPRADPSYFDRILPAALDAAIDRLAGRWEAIDAIVVDEGQDFDVGWLTSLTMLLADPVNGTFYLFHDPAQAIYRPDEIARLGLREYELPGNCRNARPIHAFVFRFYRGDVPADPMREDGRPVEILPAEPGEPTTTCLGDVLARLVKEERVASERIAVLSGVSLAKSEAWRRRRFRGGIELWNPFVDDAGQRLSEPRPPENRPRNGILIDSIHRYKGLEADVVVLAELRPDDGRLEQLLYVGGSRAKHHLVVIAPPELAGRLAGEGAAASG